jgi:hypothetical protein
VEISQFSRRELPYVLRVFDRVGPSHTSRVAVCLVLPSAKGHGVGTRFFRYLAAHYPARTCPCQRFADDLTIVDA